MSELTFSSAVADTLEVFGKAEAAGAIIAPAVTEVAKELAGAFLKSGTESIDDWIVTDPERMALRMKGLTLANEINSEIDWPNVPFEIMDAAILVLRTAAGLAVLLG